MKIVTRIAHGNADMYLSLRPGALILNIVTRKLIELIVIETTISIRAPAPRLIPIDGLNCAAVCGE